MGRPTKFTQEVIEAIGKIYSGHPNWSIRIVQKKIPEFVNIARKNKADKAHTTFVKMTAREVPGRTRLNTYFNEIILPNMKKMTQSGIDQSWAISSLPDHPINPQSLPIVLEIFYERLVKDEVHITIREALWIGRLAHLITDKEILWRFALDFASVERAYKIQGIEFNSALQDIFIYEEMKRLDLHNDYAELKIKLWRADQKNKKMIEDEGRHRKGTKKPATSAVAHLNGVQIYPPKESNQKEAK